MSATTPRRECAPAGFGVQIFCRVIDNFGDAGVCLRLAKRFAASGCAVTLVCDRLDVLAKLAPGEVPNVPFFPGIRFEAWRDDYAAPGADLVFETFGCRLPEPFEKGLVGTPCEIYNLDYLSAEDWVETCHDVEGLHPILPIKKRWYFPGFTDRTGGLLIEPELEGERAAFDEKARARFLADASKGEIDPARALFFAFGYPDDDAETLINGLLASGEAWTLWAAPGGLADKFETLVKARAIDPSRLAFVRAPFLPQADFDRFLYAADAALVRGEDSFVRAQLAGTPFFWSIYRTEDLAHEVKFAAWSEKVAESHPGAALEAALWANDAWLKGRGSAQAFAAFLRDRALWRTAFEPWRRSLIARGDLVERILAKARRSKLC